VRATAKRVERPELDATLVALADPVRRRVVDLLKVQPRRAGELAELLGQRAPAMSKHLKVLRSGALIEAVNGSDDARVRVYRLRPERLEELRDWLGDVRTFWNDQLGAFKARVEAQSKARRR